MDDKQAIAIKNRHSAEFLKIPGVEGVGVGRENDMPILQLLASEPIEAIRRQVPLNVEGLAVRIVSSGKFTKQ